MANNNHVFAIDDGLNTADNLAAYAQVLERMDAALGAALRPHLMSLAAAEVADTEAIWDALYVASAVTNRDPSTSGAPA